MLAIGVWDVGFTDAAAKNHNVAYHCIRELNDDVDASMAEAWVAMLVHECMQWCGSCVHMHKLHTSGCNLHAL